MSENNLPPASGLSLKVKYTFLFSSWVFLSAFSFYLGMSLMGTEAAKPQSKLQKEPLISPNGMVSSPETPKVESVKNEEATVSDSGVSNPAKDESLGESLTQPETQPVFEMLPEEKGKLKSSAWSTDWSAMQKTVHLYNEIHPFIYTMRGGLSNTGELISSWSTTARKERVEELRRLNPKVKIIPTIFRWENPKEKIQENIGMGGRNDIRDKHIQIIVNEIVTYNYDGIDIDYEGMTCDKKEKFEEFFVLLAKEVHKKGKLISVAEIGRAHV